MTTEENNVGYILSMQVGGLLHFHYREIEELINSGINITIFPTKPTYRYHILYPKVFWWLSTKCKDMLDDHLDLYQCYTNFIRTHSALTIGTPKRVRNIERTPCMAEGITKHPWTWKEFLMF